MDSMTVKDFFWKMLPIKMAEAGMRQSTLAESLGVSRATVNLWIHKKAFPEMKNIQKIAEVLHCKPEDLLGKSEPDNVISYDQLLVSAFHSADESIQFAVCKLLEISGEPERYLVLNDCDDEGEKE